MAEYTITDTDLDAIKLATRALRANDLLFNAVRLDTLIERLTAPPKCGHQYILSATNSFTCTRIPGHTGMHKTYFDIDDAIIQWGPSGR